MDSFRHATLATVGYAATWKETQAMPQTSDTTFLILDFQVGIGDEPYAKSAAQRAAAALKAGRAAGLPIVFSKVKFRPMTSYRKHDAALFCRPRRDPKMWRTLSPRLARAYVDAREQGHQVLHANAL